MNYFLSKYYALEKATLPKIINLQTIESLAQQDIPGIFSAKALDNVTLSDGQIQAIQDFRTLLAKNYTYTPQWTIQWELDFSHQHGALTNILGGWAWVTLVSTGVRVVARGELLVWRIRANETLTRFENHDAIEPTQMGDTWLITWDQEVAQPTVEIPEPFVALDYAQKLDKGQTSEKRFYILTIENQVDIKKTNSNQVLKKRIMAINKRLEMAELQKKTVKSAIIQPTQKPIEASKEAMPSVTIPFIDLVAAFFIKKQQVDNQNLMCIDFGADKTTIYKFRIENQRFIYKYEWQFETPESTQQLISSVEKDKSEVVLEQIKETWKMLEEEDMPRLLLESPENTRLLLTFGDIKKGIDEWIQKCIQNIDNHEMEHCILLTHEWVEPVLSQDFKKQYPKLTGKTHNKNSIYEDGSKLHNDTIYPNLTKDIGFQLYDDKNESTQVTLFNAGTPYKVYSQAHYLPFRNWILLNEPFVPSILVDNQRFELDSIDLNQLVQQSTKKMGQYLLADFHFGLSINGHFELILHLKNNFKITSFNIGKL